LGKRQRSHPSKNIVINTEIIFCNKIAPVICVNYKVGPMLPYYGEPVIADRPCGNV
jgi:hypothetical protein